MTMAREYEYATTHETPAAREFKHLAGLYSAHQDEPTLGLLRASAADIRREMAGVGGEGREAGSGAERSTGGEAR